MMVATVKNVIKVTVDGPRDARIPKPCTKRPADQQTPSLFPPDVVTQSPQMPMSMVPQPWWPLPMTPTLPPSFFPIIPPGAQFPAAFWKFHADAMKTPGKIRMEQENESLNTSTCLTSPTLCSTLSSIDRSARRSTSPPSKSPTTINLIQATPESVPAKRRRNISITSSTGSSPTIWRPF
uniref:Runt domain-containing protein n=1 Tax=Caenorhabditis japonica TaxID=281687 RepID=A0A8R1ID29_CAEJA